MKIIIQPQGNTGNWFHLFVNENPPILLHRMDPRLLQVMAILKVPLISTR